MTSKIDLFIYEVKGPSNIKNEYEFGQIKKNNHINDDYFNDHFIKPSFNKSFLTDEKKYYSRNILMNFAKSNKNNKNIFTKEIIKSTNKDNIKKFFDDFNTLYQLYLKYPARLKLFEKGINLTTVSKINSSSSYNKAINEITPIVQNENLNLSKKIYQKMDDLFIYNKESLKNQFSNYFESTKKLINQINSNSEIIYYMNTSQKIIVIGDIHGSFHSFFRIILRFYIKGIIKDNFELDNNYKIIFLGDVIDRGYYSIEILYIILRLMEKNNSKDGGKLNVILIRGNHEEEQKYEGSIFEKERNKKLTTNSDTINNFFKYCPSAIRLIHNNSTVYWLCHGGFSIKNDKSKGLIIIDFRDNILKDIKTIQEKSESKYDNNKEISNIYLNNIDDNTNSQIRWNNFSKSYKTFVNTKRCGKTNGCEIYEIGYKELINFCNMYNIHFIIRGNSNNESNAFLSIINKNNTNIENIFDLNEKLDDNVKSQLNKIIEYKDLKSKKTENEILSINPNEFKNNNTEFNRNDNTYKLLPVLTISNNCDNGGNLYSDSYIIINNQ